MNKLLSNLLKYSTFLGIGIFLVWWSLHQIPSNKWTEFKQSMLTANFLLLIPVFIILSSSHILRAIRWNTLMKPMGFSPKFSNTFFAVMIGYLANLAIPRLGEVLKCTILSKYEKVPTEKLVGTIVTERAVDVVCLLIVFLLAFITQYQIVGEYAKQIALDMFANKTGSFSIVKIAIAVSIVLVFIFGSKFLLRKFAHLRLVIAIEKILKGIWEGFISIRHLKQKTRFILCTIGIWSLYILGTWVGLYATQGTNHLGLSVAISALAFASLGMILTPGGIGAYAFFLAKVLEKNDVPFEIGYANGTLQWFAQFLIIVVVGALCLILLPIFNKTKLTHETN